YAPFALILSALHLILRAKSQHILVNVREWHFVQHSLYRGFMEIPRLRSPFLRPNTMRAIRLLPYGSHILKIDWLKNQNADTQRT
ncbi:hypothetical protein, partial [uncultured Porphyromonas sp.]|uniref:hypothetical protein n=2 Tax=uncultured Porphyromonas sp. TaxID=159274 RepID=UPI0027DB1511